MKISDIKYGLIVLDPETFNPETGLLDIVHFVGYQNKPNKRHIEYLREELSKDEEFGLIDIIDRLIIVEADSEIVDYYKTKIK